MTGEHDTIDIFHIIRSFSENIQEHSGFRNKSGFTILSETHKDGFSINIMNNGNFDYRIIVRIVSSSNPRFCNKEMKVFSTIKIKCQKYLNYLS